MSTDAPIEIAEEALNKLEGLTIVDDDSKDKAEGRQRRPRLTEEERRAIWEEKQALKPVLETGLKGKVKWYSVTGKYGFISREGEEKDVFVHQTAISKSAINRFFLRTLADEEEVEFDIVNGDKGPEAANVTGPDGSEVKGSRYYHILMRHNRRRSAAKKSDDANKSAKKDENSEKKAKKGGKRRNRRDSKKTDRKDRVKGEGKSEEEEEAPGTRRSVSKKSVSETTDLTAIEASGDAALGAQPCVVDAVC